MFFALSFFSDQILKNFPPSNETFNPNAYMWHSFPLECGPFAPYAQIGFLAGAHWYSSAWFPADWLISYTIYILHTIYIHLNVYLYSYNQTPTQKQKSKDESPMPKTWSPNTIADLCFDFSWFKKARRVVSRGIAASSS